MGLVQLLRRSTKRSVQVQTAQRSDSPKLPSDLVISIFQLAIDHANLDRRLCTLAIFARVFAASRTWAQQALVGQARVGSLKRVRQLHSTLLARPDLAWSVKSLEVETKGGEAEAEAISRLLLACPVLEELRLEGPAQIPAALLTVASLNTPTLHRLSLINITLHSTLQFSSRLKRLSRLAPAPSMPLQLPSVRQLSLRRTTLHLGQVKLEVPSLVDLSFDIVDHQPTSAASSCPNLLLPLAAQLRSLSIHRMGTVASRFLASCTSLQLLSVPLQDLDAFLGAHLTLHPRILRLTDDPSAPCTNEMLAERISYLLQALGQGQTAVSALQLLVVPDAQERDFWGERALAEMRHEADIRAVRVVEEGSLTGRVSEEQFWELCAELERVKQRDGAETASRGIAP